MTQTLVAETLVADVGGTNIRFGIASDSGNGITIEAFEKFPGDDFSSFSESLSRYVASTGLPTKGLSAVFAMAGPPNEGEVKLTNRDWIVRSDELINTFGLGSVHLVNDFIAMARAVPELGDSDFKTIRPGTALAGAPIVVAGPGTGFGVSTLLPLPGGSWHVIGGEGGHMAYAPQTPLEHELTHQLRKACGYVSTELVCAGIGLEAVHRALCEIFGKSYQDMPPGEMIIRAQEGDEMFLALCRLRARSTLRAAGDLVLANGALGGAVIAGGVSERLVDFLTEEDTVSAFATRSANSHYLNTCPVNLLTNPIAPLIGAAALNPGKPH